MIDSIEDKIMRYLSIYQDLYEKLKWQAQTQILMMVPLTYILNDKAFNLEEFVQLSDYIKEKTDFFSPLHSYQRFSTAALLIAKYDNPREKFQQLIEYQEKLKSQGFKNGPYLSISALALMTTDDKTEDLECRIEKSMEIYKGMKNNHFFLTSHSDYPISILLSQNKGLVEDLMEEIEYYYNKLSEDQFKKGNDLQFLSHILMLAKIENKDFIIDRCREVYSNLVDEDLKIRRLHYPQIGLMSIIDSNLKDEIVYIKEIVDVLNKEKGFKWTKDINLIVAIVIVISDIMKYMNNDITIIETGITTSIETIIEAQNAALIAVIASTSAASASMGSN